MRRWSSRTSAGFTLIEVMVSVAVFAVISAAMLVALNQVLNSAATSKRALGELAAVQRAFVLIGEDLRQTADRPARTAIGDVKPAFSVEPDGFEFSRAGDRRIRGDASGDLRRIGYRLTTEGELVRLRWPRVDRARRGAPVRQVLLEDVDSWRLRYYLDGEWHDQWPPRRRGDSGDAAGPAYPRGVAIRLVLPGHGAIKRTFELP